MQFLILGLWWITFFKTELSQCHVRRQRISRASLPNSHVSWRPCPNQRIEIHQKTRHFSGNHERNENHARNSSPQHQFLYWCSRGFGNDYVTDRLLFQRRINGHFRKSRYQIRHDVCIFSSQ